MCTSRKFVGLLEAMRFDQLGAAAVKAAKDRCIDYLGALAGGVRQGALAGHLLRDMAARKQVTGESSIIGTPYRAPADQAALANGVTGHALELDDGDRKAYGHPAVVVFSALFPVAEAMGASGKDFLLATAVGYETYARLGRALNPGALRRGYHTTGIAGCLAAAMAVAKLRKFDAERMLNTLGVAGLFSSGLSITFRSGGTLKPLNAGRAAFNGVAAAQLAALGAEGAPDILEGKDGFFQAYSGQEASEDIILAAVQAPLGVEQSYVKFYPSCRYTHAPIDAALALRSQVDLDDVREIVITTYPTAIYLAAKKELPSDAATSRFNIGFAAALALVQGYVGVNDFHPDKAANPKLRDLFGKIRFVEDAAYDCVANNIRGASMSITTGAGTASIDIPLPVGEPENPAPTEMYAAKFADLAGAVWDVPRRQAILDCVERLDRLDDIRDLMCLLEGPAPY